MPELPDRHSASPNRGRVESRAAAALRLAQVGSLLSRGVWLPRKHTRRVAISKSHRRKCS
jgi:hypothetical protein